MLLRHSLELEREAAIVEGAVQAALDAGVMTRDLKRRGAVSTADCGAWIAQRVREAASAPRRAA